MIIIKLATTVVVMLLPKHYQAALAVNPPPRAITPAPLVARVQQQPTVAAFSFSDLPSQWQCIAWHESTDNTQAVNPYSGDQGAFQFALSTWAEYAPAGFPTEPIDATLQQQYEVALLLWQKDGFSPWQTSTVCGLG